MEQTVNTFRNYLRKKEISECARGGTVPQTRGTVPQLGFRVAFSDNGNEVRVKVIGARQLPVEYVGMKPTGYLVKVTLYPLKEKYETRTAKESWPTFNEEFKFNLTVPTKYANDILKGTFASFTVYALMEKEEQDEKSQHSSRPILKRQSSFKDTMDEIISVTRRSFRRSNSHPNKRHSQNSIYNRRIVGTVIYYLERKNFTQRLHGGVISTPDVWRNVVELTGGFQSQPRDGIKGCVELTLQYGISEDRTNDVVEVTITKFRCSLQTMRQHEKVGGQLYIKITAFEDEDMVQKMKSDTFSPTISLKMEASSSTLRASVNQYNVNHIKILIRLISKNIVAKKVVLGKIEIDPKSAFWKEIVATPAVPVTKMVNFE